MNQSATSEQLGATSFLDCSAEVTTVRSTADDRRGWNGKDLDESQWLFKLDQATTAELHHAADIIAAHPVDRLLRTPQDIDLPQCQKLYNQLRDCLTNSVGFCVVDRLPVDDYSIDTLVEIYWVLSQLIGRPVAQKRTGQLIYDVRDTSRTYTYGVRGSWTNVELNFHTDNAFGQCPPEYVSLFCKQPAKTGGVSRFCSLYSVHKALERRYPAELQRLYQPMLYDRQKEHLDGEPPVTLAPFFSWHNDKLRARANPSLVRKGYEVAGVEMDNGLQLALSAIDEISTAPELWYEASLEKGQMQYLNNAEIGHYRSEFTDHQEPERKRHLYRLWHRNSGSICYDGVT